MAKKLLKGLGVAMVTPFRPDGAIDFEAAKRIIDYQLAGGVDFLVLLGTTGEAPTLSPSEQAEFVRAMAGHIAGRVPVMVGASGNYTEPLCAHLRAMDVEGVDYILSAVPSYNKPAQTGIIAHFERVAEAAKRPIILYNVPGRTGVNMTAETTCRLAKHPNVAGVKEASGNLTQVARILANRPENFSVLSGDDALTLPMMAMGAEGVISVIGNALPKPFAQLVHHCLAGEFQSAATLHLRLLEAYDLLFAENNPAGVKAALAALGHCENALRLPLVPVSEGLYEKIACEFQPLAKL